MASSVSEARPAAPAETVTGSQHLPARPLIGLTTYLQRAAWSVWDTEAAVLPAEYIRMVVDSGGVPVLLPPHGTAAAMLEAIDGLVLTGGADVGPSRYGQAVHPTTREQPWRDDHEFFLLESAREKRMPVLGICRGLQVINAATGGTLHQHLPEVLGHSERQPGPGVYGRMTARTTPGSRIAGILGEAVQAPCYHHQAVDRVGNGLQVTARAGDGVVEVLESPPGEPWLLAVQWHPEHDPRDMRVMAAFVAAAGAAADARATPPATPADHSTEGRTR